MTSSGALRSAAVRCSRNATIRSQRWRVARVRERGRDAARDLINLRYVPAIEAAWSCGYLRGAGVALHLRVAPVLLRRSPPLAAPHAGLPLRRRQWFHVAEQPRFSPRQFGRRRAGRHKRKGGVPSWKGLVSLTYS